MFLTWFIDGRIIKPFAVLICVLQAILKVGILVKQIKIFLNVCVTMRKLKCLRYDIVKNILISGVVGA